MTRVIIEVKPNDAAREYAANTDGVEVYDDRIVLDGMAQHIRDAINALARIGMIEKPKPPRAVFFIRDPDGKRHQRISDRNVYAYAVVSKFNRDSEIKQIADHYSSKRVLMAEYEWRVNCFESDDLLRIKIGADLLEPYDDFDDFCAKWPAVCVKHHEEKIKDIEGYKVSFYTNIGRAERAAAALPKYHYIHVATLETEQEGGKTGLE